MSTADITVAWQTMYGPYEGIGDIETEEGEEEEEVWRDPEPHLQVGFGWRGNKMSWETCTLVPQSDDTVKFSKKWIELICEEEQS